MIDGILGEQCDGKSIGICLRGEGVGVDDGKMSGKGPRGGRGGSENQLSKGLGCLHA